MDHSGQAVKPKNKNDMSHWPDIACQRGPDHAHVSRVVDVDLSRTHGYGDLPQVPARLARSWRMNVWDSGQDGAHPVDGGPYCPAHDAVSETILSHHIWEPQETILVSQVMSGGGRFSDVGAQIGWFSMLALASGAESVVAIDADTDNLRLADESARLNGWGPHIFGTVHLRIGPDTEPITPLNIRLAKIDIEGAEAEAVRVLRPSIDAGLVDHLLIECSPVFNDTYPDLVVGLMESGYRAYVMPPKYRPPILMDDPERALSSFELSGPTVRTWVAAQHQFDCWFVREGASW